MTQDKQESNLIQRHIRNIPEDVYRQAKVDAIRKGISLGEYITEALREKHERESHD